LSAPVPISRGALVFWTEKVAMRGLASCIWPSHVNLIQGGVLMGAFNLIRHPLFFFIQFHQSGFFPKMGVKKATGFCTYGVGNRERVLMFCVSVPFEPASI